MRKIKTNSFVLTLSISAALVFSAISTAIAADKVAAKVTAPTKAGILLIYYPYWFHTPHIYSNVNTYEDNGAKAPQVLGEAFSMIKPSVGAFTISGSLARGWRSHFGKEVQFSIPFPKGLKAGNNYFAVIAPERVTIQGYGATYGGQCNPNLVYRETGYVYMLCGPGYGY